MGEKKIRTAIEDMRTDLINLTNLTDLENLTNLRL